MDRQPLMNTKQLAEYLGIKPGTIRIWTCKGKIPFIKVNGATRFRLENVDRWINRNTVHPKVSA